jgi:dolichyl-diphosphooligosaccharide--protein glycosyltransferase
VDHSRATPALRWKWLAVCALAFGISAGVRLVEAFRWDAETHRVDGEYLLATHDAYAWISGAEWEPARTSGSPMSLLLVALSGLTRIPPANLAFWLPALLAAFSAIPTALWAAELGASTGASLAAGVLASLAPAFYARTRLGYYDTDWATLFFPLLISLLVAIWIRPYLRPAGPGVPDRSHALRPVRRALPLLLVIPISLGWHGYLPVILLSILGLALGLLLIQGERTSRTAALRGLLALSLAVGAGWIGALAGFLLLLLCDRVPADALDRPWGERITLGLLLAVLLGFLASEYQDFLVARIAHYFDAPLGTPAGLNYPAPGPSVSETQQVTPLAALEGAAYLWWLGVAGMVGYILLIVKLPRAILLAPLLLLGILSLRAGVRFAMFAAPVLSLGAVVPVDWWLARPGRSQRLQVDSRGAIFIAALVVFVPALVFQYARLPIETVVSRGHAAALQDLRSAAEADSLVWTWWDYGYATQHFARLPTFADGSRNNGEHLFTLGSVLGADDPRSSAGLMAFSAANGGAPWKMWDTWHPGEADAWFDRLPESAGYPLPAGPQYLVVAWDALSLLPWIQYYGSWSFESARGEPSAILRSLQPLELDLESGRFLARSGQAFHLSTADLLGESDSIHYAFEGNPAGLHLLIRLDTSAAVLLDERAYQSTLVRLLLAPRDAFPGTGDFELVVDAGPDVRVLRLH